MISLIECVSKMKCTMNIKLLMDKANPIEQNLVTYKI